MRTAIWRKLVDQQVALSQKIDGAFPARFSIDGSRHFQRELAWKYIGTNQTIYDVGGGKHPLISPAVKRERRLRVIGLDIDGDELRQAPPGAYDETICSDICSYVGNGDADLLVCHALLEHVPNTAAAFRAMATMLRPGGKALLFVPSRNAVYARLNLLLPEQVKKKVLFTLYPRMSEGHGFKSYYDSCTPRDFQAMAVSCGFAVIEKQLFYQSSYFTFFAPLYAVWRGWVLLGRLLGIEQAAETFSMVLEKQPP